MRWYLGTVAGPASWQHDWMGISNIQHNIDSTAQHTNICARSSAARCSDGSDGTIPDTAITRLGHVIVTSPSRAAAPGRAGAPRPSCRSSAGRRWCTCACPGTAPWPRPAPPARSPAATAGRWTTRSSAALGWSRRSQPSSGSSPGNITRYLQILQTFLRTWAHEVIHYLGLEVVGPPVGALGTRIAGCPVPRDRGVKWAIMPSNIFLVIRYFVWEGCCRYCCPKRRWNLVGRTFFLTFDWGYWFLRYLHRNKISHDLVCRNQFEW